MESEEKMVAAHQAGMKYWCDNNPNADSGKLAGVARSLGWHGELEASWVAGCLGAKRRDEEAEARKLRLGIARVAQALDLDPWSLAALDAATAEPRGWNALLAHIVSTLHRREIDWHNKIENAKRVLDGE